MDFSQIPARQAESFLRTVVRNAEATSSSLTRAEDKLRREIPETVAACQVLMDEQLPGLLKAAALGDLPERTAAALAAHDAERPAKRAELDALVSRLHEAQERHIAEAAAAQQERHAAELGAAIAARDAVLQQRDTRDTE